jgi:hypothetical protein
MTEGTGQGTLPGTVDERGPLEEQDNYPTPPALARVGWEIARGYLRRWDLSADPELTPRTWTVCEPGCGDDQPFLQAAGMDPRVVRLDGYDVRPVKFSSFHGVRASAYVTPADWLSPAAAADGPWSAIVTNPPFSLAEEFVRAALKRIYHDGVVVMLFRMTFLGSAKRIGMWGDHPPAQLSIIVPRPSFVKGRNDTNDYFFAVWAPWAREQRITWCTWEKPRRKGRRG